MISWEGTPTFMPCSSTPTYLSHFIQIDTLIHHLFVVQFISQLVDFGLRSSDTTCNSIQLPLSCQCFDVSSGAYPFFPPISISRIALADCRLMMLLCGLRFGHEIGVSITMGSGVVSYPKILDAISAYSISVSTFSVRSMLPLYLPNGPLDSDLTH